MARGRKKKTAQREEAVEVQEEEQDNVEEEHEDDAEVEKEPSKKAGKKGKSALTSKEEAQEAKSEDQDTSKKAARRGKRGRPSKEEEDKNEEEEPPKKAARKGKRAISPVEEAEPEYFPDKRNLEDLWTEVFPVGTEWDQLDAVYQYKWSFKNLEDAFEEGGALHGKRVYLFGCTEPQMVPFRDEQKIVCIPVVVAVVSPFPPSDKIGINSVQRETEEIVPMKRMKMDWVPYIPLKNRESMVERLKSDIFMLRCNQRRSALRHLKEDRLKKFEYCLPYFYNPLLEEEIEQNTVVSILYPVDPKPVICDFDWEFDEVEEFTNKLIEDEELTADQKDSFKGFVEEKVQEQKKANREAREARKKAREELSEEKKAAYEEMRFYKFYPVDSPDAPNVSNVKALFINRYYGKAHEIL